MKKTVRIVECTSTGREWRSNHNVTDNDEAMQKAIKKHFGSRAFFFSDAGLNQNPTSHRTYGQIFEPWRDSNTSVTGRVFIEVLH